MSAKCIAQALNIQPRYGLVEPFMQSCPNNNERGRAFEGMAYMPTYLTCRNMLAPGRSGSSSTWESFATMPPPLQLHHVAFIQKLYEAEKSEGNALTGLLLAAAVAAAESGFL